MVDPESVEARLERLGDFLGELERIRDGGREAYLADFRNRLAAQHAIQLAVQICIDIGAHMVAELGVRMPDDYKGIFTALQDPAGLDPKLAARLSDAAKMRNVLVHAYLQVDDRVVWEALEHLDDLRQFAALAESWAEDGDSAAASGSA